MTPSNEPSPYSVRFFFEGDDFFNAALAAINNAKEEILLEMYIFDMDQIGEKLLQALTEARNRRVDVHLMVDGVGSLSALDSLFVRTDRGNIDFRVYHPPLFFSRLIHRKSSLGWGRWVRAFVTRAITILYYINKRNHRKVLLVDGTTALVGSFNITQNHSTQIMGAQAWRDSAVGLTAPREVLAPLAAAFQRAWIRSRDLDQPRWRFRRRAGRPKTRTLGLFRLNDSLSRRWQLARDLRQRIRRAKKRILITNAYFLPRPSFLRLLRAAARRGVFVGLVLPAKTDVWMVREAGRTMLRKLIKDGVQVLEYQPSILHAKTMVIDDWGMVGSHNLNYRSLIHDLEVDVILQNPEHIETLVSQWDTDAKNSFAVTLRNLDQDSLWRRLVGRLVYLVRYWM